MGCPAREGGSSGLWLQWGRKNVLFLPLPFLVFRRFLIAVIPGVRVCGWVAQGTG